VLCAWANDGSHLFAEWEVRRVCGPKGKSRESTRDRKLWISLSITPKSREAGTDANQDPPGRRTVQSMTFGELKDIGEALAEPGGDFDADDGLVRALALHDWANA
jgi:hypothetical protein